MMPLEGFSVQHACHLAQVGRAGFYREWEEQEPRQLDTLLRDAMQRIALSNRLYGYRRITAAFAARRPRREPQTRAAADEGR